MFVGECAGLQAIKAFKREDFVGICGFASVDWVMADFADSYSGEALPLRTSVDKGVYVDLGGPLDPGGLPKLHSAGTVTVVSTSIARFVSLQEHRSI